MTDKTFSSRFKTALVSAKIVPLSPTRITREFNQRYYGNPVTVQAVRKWLEGKAVPESDKMVTLGRWLGVSPAWLLFAESPLAAQEGRSACNQPQLCGDFNRLTLRQQEIILELMATMLKPAVR